MDNKETALKRRFAGAWLRCFDADAAAAQVGRTDGVRLLTTNGVQEEIALQRGQCDVCRADVVRRMAQLAFGRANDCVKLVLLDAPDLDALDLSLLAEVKRRWPRVIFDNTQAFFSAPRMDADSYNVYSCRKFVGVPDGAYLVHTGLTDGIYPADTSWQHAAFLFRCIDESVNSAYGDSLDNESRFDGEIRGMSPSTRRILASVEYDALRLRRRANYEALHAALAPHNALDCPDGADAMIYPFLCRVDGLRGRLIKNKVYVSQWWKYLLELLPADSVEADYSRYLLPLPIDQRYTPDDMRALAALVLQLKEEGEPA